MVYVTRSNSLQAQQRAAPDLILFRNTAAKSFVPVVAKATASASSNHPPQNLQADSTQEESSEARWNEGLRRYSPELSGKHTRWNALSIIADDSDRTEAVSKGIARLLAQSTVYRWALNADSSSDEFSLDTKA